MAAAPVDEALLAHVRSLLRKASQRDSLSRVQKKCLDDPEMLLTETQKWGFIFHHSSRDGSYRLSFDEVQKMVRKYLKVSERVLPDSALHQFFTSISGKGLEEKVSSQDFVRHVSEGGAQAPARTDVEVQAIGKALITALRRDRVYYDTDVERWFKSHDLLGNGTWSCPELHRLFREVLRLSAHEMPDMRIRSLFKLLDKDRAGAVPAEALRGFVRERWAVQGGRPERLVASLPDDMDGHNRGSGRWARRRNPAPCGAPFNYGGREMPVTTRAGLGDLCGAAAPRSAEAGTSRGAEAASPLGSAGARPPSARASRPRSRPGSAPQASGVASKLPKRAGSARRLQPQQRKPAQGAGAELPRSPGCADRCYRFGRYSGTMNRIERQLYEAGIDVRGQLYKTQSTPQLAG